MAIVAQSLVLAAGSGGISEGLGINLWAFVSQLLSFIIVFLALWRWLLPLLLKTMDNRQNVIREGVENADRAKRALAEADERASQIVTDARRQGQEIVEQEANRIREEAHAQAEQIAQQNIARIHQEANRARADLNLQVVNLSINAAGRVVGRSVNNDDNRRLVEEFVTASNDQTRNN
jgi:F-type H+-transporting ATPase subunit b